MSALLSVRGLDVRYGREVVALTDVSFDLAPGERLGIIGESGSGKSTLALALAGLLPGSAEVVGKIEWYGSGKLRPTSPPSVLPDISPARGEIRPSSGTSPITKVAKKAAAQKLPISPLAGEMSGRTEGGNIENRLSREKSSNVPLPGRDIGFVFQDPAASLDPVMRVGEQVAEVAHAHLGLTWRQAETHAVDLFGRVLLPQPALIANAYPHQLSGGQKQRIAIAAAIAASPALLIADEPTSALDTIVQTEIVALLKRLVAEDGMALMFISHDIALASQLADRIAVFRNGALVEIGDAATVVASPRHGYTRSLIEAHIGLDSEEPAIRTGP